MISRTSMPIFTGVSKAFACFPTSIKLNVPFVLGRNFSSSTSEKTTTYAEHYKSGLEKLGISCGDTEYSDHTKKIWECAHNNKPITKVKMDGPHRTIIYSETEHRKGYEYLSSFKQRCKILSNVKDLALEKRHETQVDDILKMPCGEAREEMLFNLIMDLSHAGKMALASSLADNCLERGPFWNLYITVNNLRWAIEVKKLFGSIKKEEEAHAASSVEATTAPVQEKKEEAHAASFVEATTAPVQEKATSLFDRLGAFWKK